MQETRSTCPYCGVGCGVIISSDGQQITAVRGDPAHPANLGKLCTKGSSLHLTAAPALARQSRLLQPMQRMQRGGEPEARSWDTALDSLAAQLLQIRADHGPDALGFYLSGQLLTEDYYVFNKLVKGLLGTNNLDTNSRLCMSSAVAGYKATLGADAPPACYEDIDLAGCLFISGSNMAWAHPILFRRVEEAKARHPERKIIVVDPRRTETAELADLHLALQPGTDVMLCHGLLHIMLAEGWTDPAFVDAHTSGFAQLQAVVREATPERVAQICGLALADLYLAAQWIAWGGADAPGSNGERLPSLSLYCQGLNQSSSGTANNAALINLHLATGQIGKPGAGPLSLTGQPNAMGGREVGGLSNLLSAHRDMANPQHRAEVAQLWGVDAVPALPGKSALEMFEAAADGQIKALWIACTNPAQSLPEQAMVRRALERAELVVVQEAFAQTETTAYADWLLPATTWGEKLGTVTNSERRISRVRAAVAAPGQARHDWQIGVQLAQRLERHLRPGRPSLFAYDTEQAERGCEAIWSEHRDSTRGRDLDITGLSWALLEAQGPQQWPLPSGAAQGRQRLYSDGVFATDDGRARFDAQPWKPVAVPRDAQFPFSLNTTRLRDQWHGMSRTGQLGRLFAQASEPSLQAHPQDMQRLQLQDGDLVQLRSRYGSLVLPVQADAGLQPAQLNLPMHWGSQHLSGSTVDGQRLAGVNALTTPERCPRSKQPELKHVAVQLEKASLPWHCLGMAWLDDEQVLATRQALAALMGAFDFGSCVLFGRAVPLDGAAGQGRNGVQFRAAARQAPPAALLARLQQLLQLGGPQTLRYADAQRQCSRAIAMGEQAGEPVLQAFLLCGDTSAGQWLAPVLRDEQSTRSFGRLLLSSGSQAPAALPSRARQVCACMNVDEAAIGEALARIDGAPEQRLLQLKNTLGCGTRCGSCIPQLKQLVQRVAPAALAPSV
ncbi:MAG: molybdopterin-dependent oxidoreductase [Comamonas sp.]